MHAYGGGRTGVNVEIYEMKRRQPIGCVPLGFVQWLSDDLLEAGRRRKYFPVSLFFVKFERDTECRRRYAMMDGRGGWIVGGWIYYPTALFMIVMLGRSRFHSSGKPLHLYVLGMYTEYNFMLSCETGHSEKDLPTVRTTTLVKYMHRYLYIHPWSRSSS